MKQVLEYQGIPVGILIPRDGSLSFMAVKYDVMELDGRSFSSVTEARRAVGAYVQQRAALESGEAGWGRATSIPGGQQTSLL
jgi:hypothetical protein